MESFQRRSRGNHGHERYALTLAVLLDLEGIRKRAGWFFFVKGDDAKRVLAAALDLVNRNRVRARIFQVIRVLFARPVRFCFGSHPYRRF